jgi:hypothetical protein
MGLFGLRTTSPTVANTEDQVVPMQTLFGSIDEQQMAAYADEAQQQYDAKTVKDSQRKWRSYSEQQKQAILDDGNQIYTEIVAVMAFGPESPKVQAVISRWRHHMAYFWTPRLDQLQGLADTYVQDPRFKANFDAFHPELAAFMGKAVSVYVRRHRVS